MKILIRRFSRERFFSPPNLKAGSHQSYLFWALFLVTVLAFVSNLIKKQINIPILDILGNF